MSYQQLYCRKCGFEHREGAAAVTKCPECGASLYLRTLKPFDIKRAVLGAGVRTRDGRAVTKIRHYPNETHPSERIGGKIGEHLHRLFEDGQWLKEDENYTGAWDLFMI